MIKAIIVLGKLPSLALLLLLVGCGVDSPPESQFEARDFAAADAALPQPCANSVSTRQALFGDLHVHTSYSNDAWNFDVRVEPEDAYRFAFGGSLQLPLGDRPEAREVSIDRPLDFAAVTDHAEFFGEQAVCMDPQSPGYSASFCEVMRSGEGRAPQLVMRIMMPIGLRDAQVCGEDGEICGREVDNTWRRTVAAAERWNDTSSDCSRTAFVAYEYSSFRMGSNLHRNVIFRNAVVPARPISYLDVQREWDLWRILKERCIDSPLGCDAVAIPHNSNISNGRMFAVDYPGAGSDRAQAERARLRREIEPVIEIMQHKGDSECRNGLEGVLGAVDELCNFEKFENMAFRNMLGEGEPIEQCYNGPLVDWLPRLGPSCLDRKSYVRYALVEGLKEEQRIGENPFKFGLSASTDTHNGLAGGVQEASFPGHLGNGDATPNMRVQFNKEIPGNASNGPGGLIGVWAEHNARDAVFDAIQRREVFGTSGPRIQPRLFAGWDLESDLCEDPQMLEKAYRQGVPMGSDLPVRSGEQAPTFLVAASADAGTAQFPGQPLQQLQIVKGWADEQGNHHQQVVAVAGTPDNGASVDPKSCQPRGEGHAQLCAVWRDPAFDPTVSAVYYLRAVENPSCRYSARQCQEIPAGERPADCEQPFFDPVIQERAWSSPVWYSASR